MSRQEPDANYFPNTDYERGYADGRDALAEEIAAALRRLVSGRTQGNGWVRYTAAAGDGMDADQVFAAQILAALGPSR